MGGEEVDGCEEKEWSPFKLIETETKQGGVTILKCWPSRAVKKAEQSERISSVNRSMLQRQFISRS